MQDAVKVVRLMWFGDKVSTPVEILSSGCFFFWASYK